MTQVNYREFMESCGLYEAQVDVACAMFNALEGKAIDGNGMGQVLMCITAFVVHVIRTGVDSNNSKPFEPEKVISKELNRRITTAIDCLHDMIDGGEECRGLDSQISQIIRILEDKQ